MRIRHRGQASSAASSKLTGLRHAVILASQLCLAVLVPAPETPAAAQTQDQTSGTLFETFQDQWQTEDFAAAAITMEAIIADNDAAGTGNIMERATLAYYHALSYLRAENTLAALNAAQAGLSHQPPLTSKYPELNFIAGWAESRLGFFSAAAGSFSIAADLAEAYNANGSGQYDRATIAAWRLQQAYYDSRAFTVQSAENTIDPLRAAIAADATIRGAPNDQASYLLARALNAQGYEIEARSIYLRLAAEAVDSVAAMSLGRLAILERELGNRAEAKRTAEAALAKDSGLETARKAVMTSLIALSGPPETLETGLETAVQQVAVIGAIGEKTTYEDMLDVIDIVMLMIDRLAAMDEVDRQTAETVSATLGLLSASAPSFASDSFAQHRVAAIRLKLAGILEALQDRDRARNLYTEIFLWPGATSLEQANAQAGLGRLGIIAEGDLRDDLMTRASFFTQAAGYAESFLETIPARQEELQATQVSRLSGILQQAVDTEYDLLDSALITGPDGAPNVDALGIQTGPYVFPFALTPGDGYAASASEGLRARQLETAFRQIQIARQSTAGRAIAAMTARMSAGSDELAALLRQRDAIIAERSRILGLAGSKDLDRFNLLADIERQLDAVEADLDQRYPQFRDQIAMRPLTLAETRSLLRPNEALVTYMVTEAGLHVFIITPDKVVWYRSPLDRQWLTDTIETLRRTLDPNGPLRGPTRGAMAAGFLDDDAAEAEPGRFDLGLAHALYNKVLGPVAALLPPEQTLLIVPDGALQAIPFATMVTEAPDETVTGLARFRAAHWAIRDHAFATLPLPSTLRALRNNDTPPAPRHSFVGIGDAKFTQDPKWLRLAQLPETGFELETLNAIIADDSGRLLLQDAANEAMLAETDLRDTAVLAFATHGLMGGEARGLTEPALALTPIDPGVSAMSGARDGLLTTGEIAELDLNADWVLLSACNTAEGADGEGSEGLSGLARAFFYAGARRLVVSHWAVQSDATVALTTGMFAALTDAARDETMTADQADSGAIALQRSMLKLIDDAPDPQWTHPGIWAPFVTIGW
ncbi:CHAT domain-containing protein [Martelella sp. HB161492]|uniref:CHAT domain-containing protein n=1 Tax=Martelella sp. HB161492 TaxID=2720726 RepID=UPI001590CE0D|nr:CHAT domain-containing protein [Martelella sp. HB161492]